MDHQTYHIFEWHFIQLNSLLLLLSFFAILIFMFTLFLCAHFCRRHLSQRPSAAAVAAAVDTYPLPPHRWVGVDYSTTTYKMHASSITNSKSLLGLVVADEGFENNECCICLSLFQENEMLKVLKKCQHVYHSECLDRWLCAQPSCPICRTTLQAGNVEVEYTIIQ